MLKYQCPECSYIYNAEVGDDFEGYPPGTPFSDLPHDFSCPDCAVRFKIDFVEITAS